MYDASADSGPSVPVNHQEGDSISYGIKWQIYTGEILAIRAPTVLKEKHIGWHYVVMRDGANTCFPDIVLAEAVIAET